MCPPKSSLAPPLAASIAPSNTGPTLCPRTATRPKPGFIALTPDLWVSSLRPSPGPEPTKSDHNEDDYLASSGQSYTSDGIGSQEVIEIDDSDNSSLPDSTLPDRSNKKKNTRKAKVHVVKRRGRPRGSGASIALTWPPSKKSRKGNGWIEVILITVPSELQPLTFISEQM